MHLTTVFLAASTLLAATAQGVSPPLRFEAPPELQGEARRLAAMSTAATDRAVRLTGAAAGGDPVRVLLVPEYADAARAAPPWVAGYAVGTESTVVLFPARVPRYPDTTLEELLLHELAHVLIDRAARFRSIPRWFHEGVALIAGGPWDLRDRSRLTMAMLRDRQLTVAELDHRFGNPHSVTSAYAVTGAMMRDILRRHGSDTVAQVLAEVAVDTPFPDAFQRVTGETPEEAAHAFWRRHTFLYRWLPVLTSSATLWIGIVLLFLAAFYRRRRRDARRMAQWDREDAALDEPEPDRFEPVN